MQRQAEVKLLPCELFFSRWGQEEPIGTSRCVKTGVMSFPKDLETPMQKPEGLPVLSGDKIPPTDNPTFASLRGSLNGFLLIPILSGSHARPERNLWWAPFGSSSREQRPKEWNPSCSGADSQPHSR